MLPIQGAKNQFNSATRTATNPFQTTTKEEEKIN